jgi:hypothetical protein
MTVDVPDDMIPDVSVVLGDLEGTPDTEEEFKELVVDRFNQELQHGRISTDDLAVSEHGDGWSVRISDGAKERLFGNEYRYTGGDE